MDVRLVLLDTESTTSSDKVVRAYVIHICILVRIVIIYCVSRTKLNIIAHKPGLISHMPHSWSLTPDVERKSSFRTDIYMCRVNVFLTLLSLNTHEFTRNVSGYSISGMETGDAFHVALDSE